MGKMVGDIYEEWDLSPIQLPVRSTLYALEPVGMRTAFMESLTSYLTRLAEAHGVFPGILVNKVIAPQGQSISPHRGRQTLFMTDGRKSHLLNATGIRASRLVQILGALTTRADLHFLTLLPWSEVMYVRGLLRATKAWCPACYEEQRTNGQVVYDPLIWGFQDVSTCSLHQLQLSQRCPYQDCLQVLPPLTWRSRAGYCSMCGRWLGMSHAAATEQTANGYPEEDWPWRHWVNSMIGDLLAVAWNVSSVPSRTRVAEALTFCIQQPPGKSISEFAHELGVTRATAQHWFSQQKIPQMDMLLRICSVLGISLCEFLLSDLTTLCPRIHEGASKKRLTPLSKWKGKPLDQEQMRQVLWDILAEKVEPPPSVNEVARRLGYDSHVLYKCDKATCRAISARYLEYIRRRREERIQQLRKEVRLLAQQLHAEGKSLSKHHLAQVLQKQGYLRSPELREAFEEARCELEGKKNTLSY